MPDLGPIDYANLQAAQREQIANWLTDNDINPNEVPLAGGLHVADLAPGARVIRYCTLAGEGREYPLRSDLPPPAGVPEVIDWQARAERAEAAIERVRAVAADLAKGCPWSGSEPYAAERILTALEEPKEK
ncbi:hypothetical protein [Streptomyces wuyuanensis]|uniref:Uncharacterized protein n=1 Tax=Streptomyces wuyuanensis TaxID=1196353 RepID=A0A1G9VXG3_9ACTN|nr:hypothetical protein [Streptomyces wuyuanensis]SDM76793.1 hypothetical protein SAMN05444921_11331 [Streptomyces wuyuanensis]